MAGGAVLAERLDLDANYFVALHAAGGIYSRLGRHEEALDAFTKGVSLPTALRSMSPTSAGHSRKRIDEMKHVRFSTS